MRVIGRRQIEMYSRLIHTVDHIEGRLREGMDAFDAFLSHAWAVTVTGAPKLWAMRFIENHEKSPRAWYGGAIGMVHFNGDMNTGLTLRTIRIKDGIAEVRAGATLLFDSDPEEEEAETELKASAHARRHPRGRRGQRQSAATREAAPVGEGLKILLVDHEDSFVHTLANYFRQTGADGVDGAHPGSRRGVRPHPPRSRRAVARSRHAGGLRLRRRTISEGARAATCRSSASASACRRSAEAYGGELRQLRMCRCTASRRAYGSTAQGLIFSGLPKEVTVGRYHSIFADPVRLPDDFEVTAETDDGIVMAVEHKTEPVAAVQFHPESIMTLGQNAGMRMIENIVAHLPRKAREKAA